MLLVRSPGRTVLALLIAMTFAGWEIPPPRLHAQAAEAPDLIPFAQAYTAAWNAHDLNDVLAFFAPGAVVRERRGEVPLEVWDTRDAQVVRAYLNDAMDGNTFDPDAFQWKTGPQQIGAFAAARFAEHHRCAAGQFGTAGDTISWPYQEFIDPFQNIPGVSPLEGTAEAVVRGGRITTLTLVLSPASLQRRRRELRSVLNQTVATQGTSRSPMIGGAASGQPRRLLRDGPAAAEPTTLAWPLALSGLAFLAAIMAVLRRRAATRT